MLNLVVMGDSIAKGYGSTNPDLNSFGAILGQKLSSNVTNLGIVGLDSEGLIEKLSTEKFQNAVEDADVICLSIGSNDLLKPFLSIFADTLGVEGEEKELFTIIQKDLSATAKKSPMEAANELATTMKKMTNNKKLQAACNKFPENFDQIITKIHEINPDVVIYADNIYNPYYGVAYEYQGISVFNISQLCEPYIQSLNKNFATSDVYTTVDMYSIFRQTGYTHVNAGSIEDMSEINLDPHPNDAGYQMMADYIYTYMDSTVPYVVDAAYIDNKDSDFGSIKICFSEKIRLLKDKKIIIKSDNSKDTFFYEIPENVWVEAVENDTADLTLDLADFVADEKNSSKKLLYKTEYTLEAEDGAIKDKGNNHLSENKILEFEIPTEEAQIVSVNTNTVKNPESSMIYYTGYAVGGVLLLILILLLIKKKKS